MQQKSIISSKYQLFFFFQQPVSEANLLYFILGVMFIFVLIQYLYNSIATELRYLTNLCFSL